MMLRQLPSSRVGCAGSRPPTTALLLAPTPLSHPRTSGRSVVHSRPLVDPSTCQRGACTCHAALDDPSADAAAAAAAAATAAERRRLREERRAARQQQAPAEAPASDSSDAEQQHLPAAAAAADVDALDDSSGEDEDGPQQTAAGGSRRPSSRLAARRQQRARARGAKRRVPEPLVPEAAEAAAAADADADEDDSASADDDDDVFITDSSSSSSRGGWAAEDTGPDDDADADVDGDESTDDEGFDEDSAEEQRDPEEAQTQLPQSVMQQAAAAGGGGRPRPPRQQQQQQGGADTQQAPAGGGGSSPQTQHTVDPTATATSSSSSKGGSRGGGGSSSSSGEGGGGRSVEPLELSESSPMYLPVLTDEDLEADPPGHKSGYVAVIGRPNAGKSTLINAIVGQKLSIVTYKPQTTRHRVVGIASDTHYQMILFDTPGIMQEQRSKLDERMMAAVVSSIKAAEVIIAVVDSGDSPQEALAMFQPGPDWSGPPMAVLLNKADLLSQEQVEELRQWYTDNCRAEQVFVGSALESVDAGVEAIKAWAVDKLPEGPTLYPKSMVSEQPERFFVSEIIREQIFVQYDQEIPYSCQVQIADFKERRGAKDFIQAVILVERETQAPIVLGRGGAAIKKLGSASRQQIEEFLGRNVYLELSVQVAPAWRQQADKLKDFGYYDALYVS